MLQLLRVNFVSHTSCFAFFCVQTGVFVKFLHSGLNARVRNSSKEKNDILKSRDRNGEKTQKLEANQKTTDLLGTRTIG
jgi:hypothetical protein